MAKKNKLTKQELKSEELLVAHGRDVFNRSVTYNDRSIKDRWLRDNALYDSKFVKNVKRGDNTESKVIENSDKLFIPKTYSHLNRIQGDVLSALFFDPEEIVSVSSRKSIDNSGKPITEDVKQAVKKLLNFRLNGNPINFYQEAVEFVQDSLRNMVGIFKIYPKISETDGVITDFHPIVECVPYEDMFFSPEATWKDYYKFPIIHRKMTKYDNLCKAGYKNLDKVKEAILAEADEVKMQRLDTQGSPFSHSKIRGINVNNVYIYEVWTFLDVNQDGFLESVKFTMAGNEHSPEFVISDVEENDLPFKRSGDEYNRPPYIVGTPFPESHRMYGKSLPQITEQLQREINAIRNQKREAVALSIRSPLLVQRGSNIDLDSLVNRRIGGIALGDEISDASVRQLVTNTNFDNSYTELSITDNDFNQVTSVDPNRLGVQSKGEQTATEVQVNNQNSNRKTNAITTNLLMTGFIPLFENLLRLEQQYETDEFIQKVTGSIIGYGSSDDNAPTIDTIQGSFDILVNQGQSKQANINKLVTMLQLGNQSNATVAQLVQAGVLPASDATFVNPSEVMRRIYEILGEKGEELYIQAQQPPPQEAAVQGVASQARPNEQGGQGFGV